MSIPTDHPFKPGTRVAIRFGYNDKNYRECFVDKVHKTGHFTLQGDTQRWRPSLNGGWGGQPPRWTADKTGDDHWSRQTVFLWDETTDKEITEGIAKQKRRDRLYALQKQIERLRPDDITDEALTAIEAALPAKAEGRDPQ